VTLASLPLFIREGAFLFRQPVVQHTRQMGGQPLMVEIYPAERSETMLYEDDGRSLAYQRGDFVQRKFVQSRSGAKVRVEIGAAEGTYRPQSRSLNVAVLVSGATEVAPYEGAVGPPPVGANFSSAVPTRVTINGTAIQRFDATQLAKETTGWAADERGFIVVKLPDRYQPLTIEME
jgi:hypothetical protein